MSATPMMDATGLTDSRDGKHEKLREMTIRMILARVLDGDEYRDAVDAVALYVHDLCLESGTDPVMCRGMRRLVIEIGAAYGCELLTGQH